MNRMEFIDHTYVFNEKKFPDNECIKHNTNQPLSMLFPDCILCMWSANVYSHAIVANLHDRAVQYSGDEKPHVNAYSKCVDDWYECYKIKDIATNLTKEECVAHFTSNILCRFNRQRSQPTLLFNSVAISEMMERFPSMDTQISVKDELENKKDVMFWCPNAFLAFIIHHLVKFSKMPLPEKKQRKLYNALSIHTDGFVSQWARDVG